MTEEQKNTNANPATPVTQNQNQNIPSAGAHPGPQTGEAPAPRQAAQAPAAKVVQRGGTLITNPPKEEPAVVEEEKAPAVTQSTLDEMEAGKRALQRNRPTSLAREQAQARSAEAAKA